LFFSLFLCLFSLGLLLLLFLLFLLLLLLLILLGSFVASALIALLRVDGFADLEGRVLQTLKGLTDALGVLRDDSLVEA